MDDHARVRKRRTDVKIHYIRAKSVIPYSIMGECERKSEQKKKTDFVQLGECPGDLLP